MERGATLFMAYNSKDTAAFKGVWVFCEQRDGVILGTGYQLLSEGRKLADDLGVELCGVLLHYENKYVNGNLHRYTPEKALELEYRRQLEQETKEEESNHA